MLKAHQYMRNTTVEKVKGANLHKEKHIHALSTCLY